MEIKVYKFTEEHRKNLSIANTGHHPTEETIKKISAANKGQKRSEEFKRKCSETHLGFKHTDETKQKMSEAQKGDKSPNWKGGRTNHDGYVSILTDISNHYVLEHRLVMEQSLGRKLFEWEMVHHINGIRDDNRIENLELLNGGVHNTKIQKVYQENLQLKQRILELELRLVS